MPLSEIIDGIWREKVNVLKAQMALVQQMKEYV